MAPRKNASPTAQMFVEETPIEEANIKEATAAESAVTKAASLPSSDHNVTDLPSAGKFGYPEYVEYRDILVKDEEVLAGATAETYAKTLNAVLKAVMNECAFYEDMIIHDRDFMLLWIWANNYTAVKDVEITCGSCATKTKHKVDLTQLPFSEVKENIKVPFAVPLKKTGGQILVRLNTVADELFAAEYTKKNKNAKFEHVMMVRSIDVGIEMPFDLKLKWIGENVSGREMGMIRKFHSHFAFGVDPVINHTCPACGEVTRGNIPFQTEDILFPTVSADFEELL